MMTLLNLKIAKSRTVIRQMIKKYSDYDFSKWREVDKGKIVKKLLTSDMRKI